MSTLNALIRAISGTGSFSSAYASGSGSFASALAPFGFASGGLDEFALLNNFLSSANNQSNPNQEIQALRREISELRRRLNSNSRVSSSQNTNDNDNTTVEESNDNNADNEQPAANTTAPASNLNALTALGGPQNFASGNGRKLIDYVNYAAMGTLPNKAAQDAMYEKLDRNEWDHPWLVENILLSPASRALNPTPDAIVARMYPMIMGRESTAEERAPWLAALASGRTTVHDIAREMLESQGLPRDRHYK